MKQDKLERFVSENKQAFDELEPSMQIWEQIDKSIKPKKPNLFIKISWQIAAAIAIFVASYYFHDYVNDNKVYYANTTKQIKNVSFIAKQAKNPDVLKTINHSKPNKNDVNVISKEEKQIANNSQIKQTNNQKNENGYYSELNELSIYYTSKINKEKNDLFILTANNPEVKKEINDEFGKLDKAYKELKNDLKENINNEQVIEAMIENYKLKMEMLEFIKRQVSIEVTEKNDKNETKYDM
ncbi:MAG: hypothetical protein HY951_11280 [Bacteroidia bacterium]|nr:hypothetical protein [Bacteroidia bacterium]